MATYIKTLKEDNGDITYPQTKAGAVLLNNGSDLEAVLAAKADASTVNQKITVGDVQSTDIVANAVTSDKLADNAVTTPKIADGAVTSDKIDWATSRPTKSNTTSGGSTTAYWVKRVYPDGTIVYSGYATGNWWTGANAWYADLTIQLPDSLAFDTAKMMASISVQPADSAIQGWGSVHEGANSWSICRSNRYGADITTTFYINLILVVFPT